MFLLEILFYLLVLIVTGFFLLISKKDTGNNQQQNILTDQDTDNETSNNQQNNNNSEEKEDSKKIKPLPPIPNKQLPPQPPRKTVHDKLNSINGGDVSKKHLDLSSPRTQHSREDSLTLKSNESIFDEITSVFGYENQELKHDAAQEGQDELKIEKTPIERKRDRILEEIMTTEESYVKGLRSLGENYMEPLREVLSKETFELIFNDIAIIKGVNENFLKELKKIYFTSEGLSSLSVAKLLLHYAHSFKLYTRFIGNYGIAVSTLEEERKKNGKFRKMLEEIAEKLNDEATIPSDYTIDGHLVLPLQRIPRYQLLLQQLREFTDNRDESYSLIESALSLIKEIASELNNRQLEYSNIHKSLEIGETFKLKDFFIPTRRLLYYFEGENDINYKRSNGKVGVMDLYVFTDLILLNRRSGFLSKQEYIFAPHSKDDNCSTSSLHLEDDPDNHSLILTCIFKSAKTEPRVLEMYFDKKPEQFEKVKEAMQTMMDNNQNLRKSISSRSSI